MSGDEGIDAARARSDEAHAPPVATVLTDTEVLLNTPLATMFDALPDAVFIYTADGRILRTNSSARKLFALEVDPSFAALSVEERLAVTDVRALDGTLIPSERYHVPRILAGETVTGENPLEACIRSLDGQERIFAFTGAPIRNRDGKIIGAIAVGREISEQRRRDEENAQLLVREQTARAQAEDALTRLQQRDVQLRQRTAMLNRTHEAIFIWELGGPITYWNRGAEILYGYTTEQAVGQSPHALLRTDHAMDIADFEALLRREGEWTGELQHTTRDGRTVDVLSRHQIMESDGKLYVLETSRDITERKQMERDLAARSAELEVANRQMDEFLSVVGHELRTPLASIKPNLQLAGRSIQRLSAQLEALSPEAAGQDALATLRTLVERALRQVNRMTRLVNDLTDASRIQSDRLEVTLAPCDLVGIVRECVDEQRQSAPDRTIRLDLPEESVPIEADALRIGQVVTNYLTNALRYTPPEQQITVTVRAKGGQARVAVRDEGPGVAKEEQARIWQRFHRVSGVQRQSESGVGLGLGLFISKSLIERHGGKVGVESKPGSGATFWFTLPVAPETPERPGTPETTVGS